MAGDTYPRFRAAAVQAAPVFLDREATISRLAEWVAKARMLRCSMKTAWFLGHRIRESMREVRDMFTPPMGGAGRTIEADPLAEASATARRRQRTMRSP